MTCDWWNAIQWGGGGWGEGGGRVMLPCWFHMSYRKRRTTCEMNMGLLKLFSYTMTELLFEPSPLAVDSRHGRWLSVWISITHGIAFRWAVQLNYLTACLIWWEDLVEPGISGVILLYRIAIDEINTGSPWFLPMLLKASWCRLTIPG